MSAGGLPPRRIDQAAAPAAPGMLPAPHQNVFPVVYIVGPGGRGLFTYSPSVGPGNLVASTGFAQGGTDHGNAYLAYDTTYVRYPNGIWVAFQTGPGGAVWWFASSEAGPWTAFASEVVTFNGTGGTAAPILALFPNAGFMNGVSGTGNFVEVWIHPSGDTTGGADANLINALFASGCTVVHLLPGLFYVNAPIVVGNGQTLQGAGISKTYLISAATSAITCVVCLGPLATSVEWFQPALIDITVKGNAFSGHNVIVRAQNPILHNVYSQFAQTDAYHFSWDAITPIFVDSADVTNCWADRPGNDGFFIEQHLTSSEFTNCRSFGGVAPTMGGHYGFHSQSGQIKFLNCHSFGWLLGGYFFDGSTCADNTLIGGESESNSGPHVTISGAANRIKIIGLETYFSTAYTGTIPTSDIHVFGNSSDCGIYDCHLNGASSFAAIQTNSVFRLSIEGNNISASPYTGALPLHGIVNDAASGTSLLSIVNNVMRCKGTNVAAIDLGGASFCVVNANMVNSADNILEGAGGNFNIFTSNMVPSGVITTVGANTVSANNIV